jgi:hypothetical protein
MMCLCSERSRNEADGENGNKGSHKGVVSEKEVEMGSVLLFVTAGILIGPITATDFIRTGVCCQSALQRLTVAVSM